jgi:hypothetical protein
MVCAAFLLGSGLATAADMKGNSSQQGATQQQASIPPGTSGGTHWTPKDDNGSPTTALNILEEQGYDNVTNFHRMGSKYGATVQQNGQTKNVLVDPATRSVTPES